jgi:transcriptional adapter 3
MGSPRNRNWKGRQDMGQALALGDPNPKSKNLQPKIQEYEFTDDPIDVPWIPKSDAPNRSGPENTEG